MAASTRLRDPYSSFCATSLAWRAPRQRRGASAHGTDARYCKFHLDRALAAAASDRAEPLDHAAAAAKIPCRAGRRRQAP